MIGLGKNEYSYSSETCKLQSNVLIAGRFFCGAYQTHIWSDIRSRSLCQAAGVKYALISEYVGQYTVRLICRVMEVCTTEQYFRIKGRVDVAVVMNGFIFNVLEYKLDEMDFLDNSVKILYCHFDKSKYVDEYYPALNVNFPSTLSKAVDSRKAEYLIGRYLAKTILKDFGLSFADIGIGRNRSPVWPSGISGSISHTSDMVMCAISNSESTRYIGIDIELPLCRSTAYSVSQQVLRKDEIPIALNCGLTFEFVVSLAFSAKETLFKAIHKDVGHYFGFEAVRITQLSVSTRTLFMTLTENLSPGLVKGREFTCQWDYLEGVLFTFLLELRGARLRAGAVI